VIVVIDHNESLFQRASVNITDAKVVRNTHARGASGSRNAGADAALGDVVVYLDDDARADATWLANLIEPFGEAAVAGVGGKAQPAWDRGRPSWFPLEFDWVVGCSYRGLPTEKSSVRNLIGTNMSVRRHLISAVGGFREGFGNVVSSDPGSGERARASTCEETEFCVRLRQEIPKSYWVYQPSAVVLHRVSAERSTFRYFLSRCWIEGKGKSTLVDLLGHEAALSSERDYALKTLPRSIYDALGDSLRQRRLDGVGRAGAILAGFGATSVSFIWHRFVHRITIGVDPSATTGSPIDTSADSGRDEPQPPV
jgi:GT2 family glycosyltransferase